MGKCQYCGKQTQTTQQFCSKECEMQYLQTQEKDERSAKWFILGILLGVVVLFVGTIRSDSFLLSAAIAVMGVTVTALPMPTPQTVAWLGYRKAKFVVRLLGIAMIVTAVWIAM